MLDALETLVNGHTSSTSVGERICTHPFALVACGIHEARLVVSLSGVTAEGVEAYCQHDFKARGYPGCRRVGNVAQEGFRRRLEPLVEGLELIYHSASASLHVIFKCVPLSPVARFGDEVEVVRFQLAQAGITSDFPVRLARVDIAADVLFANPAGFLRTREAVERSLPAKGRETRRIHHSVYVHASGSSKSKREARVYDKGRERVERGGWDGFPVERLMRLEAEVTWESGQRPGVEVVGQEWARGMWNDRFGYVGSGSLSWNGGLMDRLLSLKRANVISAAEYERLFTFLEHERVGMARELYDRVTYLRRATQARALGLEVPSLGSRTDADVEYELDVRAMLDEVGASL